MMGKVNARGVVVWRQSGPDLRDSAGDCGKGPALRDSAGGVHDVIGSEQYISAGPPRVEIPQRG